MRPPALYTSDLRHGSGTKPKAHEKDFRKIFGSLRKLKNNPHYNMLRVLFTLILRLVLYLFQRANQDIGLIYPKGPL
jgi:hypothetical protein